MLTCCNTCLLFFKVNFIFLFPLWMRICWRGWHMLCVWVWQKSLSAEMCRTETKFLKLTLLSFLFSKVPNFFLFLFLLFLFFFVLFSYASTNTNRRSSSAKFSIIVCMCVHRNLSSPFMYCNSFIIVDSIFMKFCLSICWVWIWTIKYIS